MQNTTTGRCSGENWEKAKSQTESAIHLSNEENLKADVAERKNVGLLNTVLYKIQQNVIKIFTDMQQRQGAKLWPYHIPAGNQEQWESLCFI